jgi:hypothetical protein
VAAPMAEPAAATPVAAPVSPLLASLIIRITALEERLKKRENNNHGIVSLTDVQRLI